MGFMSPSLPAPPPPLAPPPPAPTMANRQVEDAEMAQKRSKAGVASTIATSPEGLGNPANTAQKTLLGA